MNPGKHLLIRLSCLLALVSGLVPHVIAADGTWTSTTSGNWSNPANWSGATLADGAGSTANFNTINITSDTTVYLDGARTIANLVFGDTSTGSAASWTIDNNGSAGNILTLDGTTTPTITVNTLGSGKCATMNTVLAGTAGMTKAGTGSLVLTGTNTYSGDTTVSAGTLLVNSPGSLAGAVTVQNAATLGGNGTINGTITVNAGGTLYPSASAAVMFTIGNSLTLAGTTILRVDRSGYPNSVKVAVGRTLTYGGTLKVVNAGIDLRAGDSFQLFSAAVYSGSFSATVLPALSYGLAWDTSRLAIDGTLAVVASTSFTHSTITLTPGTFHQQIFGIGGNFCQGDQNTLVGYARTKEVFSPQGLNLSFIRLANTYDYRAESKWDTMAASNNKVITAFRGMQPNGRIMMTAWSPPGYLKSTGSPFQGTLAKNTAGQFVYTDYGDWWLRSLQYYMANSALPDYVSIQNETDFASSQTSADYESGCLLDPAEGTRAGYPQSLAAVMAAFQANGLGSMKMIGPDTTAIANDKVPSYMNNIPSGKISAIAHHLYNDYAATTGAWRLTRLESQYNWWTIPKFMTEMNPGDNLGSSQPDWMGLAVTMHNVFSLEEANAYLIWSVMWNTVNPSNGQPASNNYYTLGHFSKYIRPNDWRVDTTSDDPNLLVSLYRHYVGPGVTDQLILVMINKSGSYSYPTIKTSAQWSSNPSQRLWQVYRTADDGSTQQRLKLIELAQGAGLSGDRNLVLPPYSITTALVNTDATSSPYTNFQVWRQKFFGSMSTSGFAANTADPDGDGENNLYEFATGQDPRGSTMATPSMVENGGNLEFTYSRSKAALADGVRFSVEWSDTLAAGDWSTDGILDQNPTPIFQDDNLETVTVAVPVGSGKRFVRLRVTL